MKELTLNEAMTMLEKQQSLIKNLSEFTKSTAETLDIIVGTLDMLGENAKSLVAAQKRLQETVFTFLAENEIDNRSTSGGTG